MHITDDTPSNHKLFVAITAEHDTNGIIKPTDRKWDIDKVYDVRQAASQGMVTTKTYQSVTNYLPA